MIIIKFCGGLGNQMYQRALYEVLKKKYPEQDIKADISHYNLLEEHNGFELDSVFCNNVEIASIDEIKKVSCGLLPSKLFHILPYKLRYKIAHKQEIYRIIMSQFFKDRAAKRVTGYGHNIFNDFVFNLEPTQDYYLDGMWQNIHYFDNYRETLIKTFTFKKALTNFDIDIKNDIENTFSVSVHIRRGDFSNSKFDICNELYYMTAINIVESIFQSKNIKYFVFSDDIEYAKCVYSKRLKNARFVKHPSSEGYIDMQLMTFCKVNIIANSTFSFWGAYLNQNNKTVIAPCYSIATKQGKYSFSIPQNWISVNPYTGEVINNEQNIYNRPSL